MKHKMRLAPFPAAPGTSPSSPGYALMEMSNRRPHKTSTFLGVSRITTGCSGSGRTREGHAAGWSPTEDAVLLAYDVLGSKQLGHLRASWARIAGARVWWRYTSSLHSGSQGWRRLTWRRSCAEVERPVPPAHGTRSECSGRSSSGSPSPAEPASDWWLGLQAASQRCMHSLGFPDRTCLVTDAAAGCPHEFVLARVEIDNGPVGS